MWIKFANLCRKSERMLLAEKTINSLLSQERVGPSAGILTLLTRLVFPASEGSSERGLRPAQIYVGIWF